MESCNDYWYDTLLPGTVLSLPTIDCSAARIARHSELFNAYHPINTSSDNRFGRAIAHGPHPVAQAMASIGNVLGDSLIAMGQLGPWRFLSPAFVGDSLTADATVIGRTAPTRGSGTVVLEIRITAPDGRVSQIGEAHLIVRQRPNPKDKP
ncbi:Acyl dehydratase [Thalassovita litoralis]|uniref:Acyl dehydratase n=1 Tax=Thalassovita litoralis TaxID=1010611 RepID=A0A521BNV2_9RHOB|nr:MaoC family dehydratase [Thalassovita litoralis]SMO48441.1 Acyl dehydratase [Thalassovita litoralis]